ncbi:MAG: mechanosensitive ion channel family protein [Candidatus Paceibacteria bacterium]
MNPNLISSLEQTVAFMSGQVMVSLPMIVTALVVIIVGWILGNLAKSFIVTVFNRLQINRLLDGAGVDKITDRAGYKLDAGYFVGVLVKWFILIVAFVVALDILRLQQVSFFLQDVVLNYLPKVIVAVLILFGALIIAKVASEAVGAALRASGVAKAMFLQKVAYYAIIFFAVLAALNQLQIAQELVQMLFAGIVFGSALAFGLAFGLGGKDAAARYIEAVTRK